MPFASPWQLPPPALLPGTVHCRQAIGRPRKVYIPVRLAGLILTGMTLHGVEAATVDCVHFLQVHNPGGFRAMHRREVQNCTTVITVFSRGLTK